MLRSHFFFAPFSQLSTLTSHLSKIVENYSENKCKIYGEKFVFLQLIR